MAIGETLLKITDYPFTYSIAFLLMRLNEVDFFSIEATPYLLGAGFGATVLAITDPVGAVVKVYIQIVFRGGFKKIRVSETLLDSWDDVKGSFHTRSIELERDRIVSIVYFVLVLFTLLILIQNSDFFDSHFTSLYSNNADCDVNCFQDRIFYSVAGIMILISIIGVLKAIKIIEYVKISATYLNSVNDSSILQSTKDNLGNYINLGDWQTAKTWKGKIEREYLDEEGLKEQRNSMQQVHVKTIIEKFEKKYDELKQNNLVVLSDVNFNTRGLNIKNILEIYQNFSLYDSLIEHLYTNGDNPIFDDLLRFVELEKEIDEGNKKWIEDKNKGIKAVLSQIALQRQNVRETGFAGPDGQWINTDMIKNDIERLIEKNRTELLPLVNRDPNSNSPLWQIKFFQSASTSPSRSVIVAELYKPDAELLKKGLDDLAEKLTRSIQESISKDFKERSILLKKIEEETEDMFTAISVLGDPIRGSCKYCRNERFFDGETISIHEKELKEFPDLLKRDPKLI